MTNPDVPAGTVTWAVISTQPSQGQLGDGSYGTGHTVTIRTALGDVGAVFIPDRDTDNLGFVSAALQRKADALAAIRGLSGLAGG